MRPVSDDILTEQEGTQNRRIAGASLTGQDCQLPGRDTGQSLRLFQGRSNMARVIRVKCSSSFLDGSLEEGGPVGSGPAYLRFCTAPENLA